MFRALFTGLIAATVVYFGGMASIGSHVPQHYVSARIN